MADPDNPDPSPMLSARDVQFQQEKFAEEILKIREKLEDVDRQQKIDRKTDQHVQNLTYRVDKLDQMFPEVHEHMFVLDSQVEKLKKDFPATVLLPSSGSSGPLSGAKSLATVPPDQTPNLYPAARRDAIATLENDADEDMDDSEEEEEDSDEVQLRATYIEQQTAETFSKAKAATSTEISDLIKLLTQVVRQNVGLQYDNSVLKNDVKELRRQARLDKRIIDSVNRRLNTVAFNHEIRVNTVEEHVRLISADTFLADYADYLDKRGYYFPDSLDKYVHRDRLTHPSHWSQGDPIRMELESKSSNSLSAPGASTRSTQIPTTSSTTVTMIPTQSTAATTGSTTGVTDFMNTRSTGVSTSFTRPAVPIPASIPAVPQDDPLVESRSDFLWYTPHLETETPPSTQYMRHNLEIGFFKAKFLYGLFIKLRPIKNIREVASRPGAIPILEALPQSFLTADNKVLLLEWQTNRAKKLNGVQRFKFDGVPIIPEGGNAPGTTAFYLEEKEPIRVIQDKLPIRLMQYETSFGPTKKRLLKVAHVTLDNRRKYYIVCPIEYWPVYEIWEMNGPRPMQDRQTCVYRSPESPVSAIGSFTGNPAGYPGSSESVEEQEPEQDPEQEPESEPMSQVSLNPGASPFSPPQGDWNEASAFEDNTALKQFADYWQGEVHSHIVQNGNNFVCSLRLTISFPSLAVGQDSNSDQQIVVSHTHPDQATAILGAQHMALSQIRHDFHPYWTMFVLQPVPFSEAYCQFLQSYLPKKTPDEKIRKWFEMRQSAHGITLCRVRYGEDMKSSESAQSSDPNEAREDASFLAMMQVQTQYPQCFLISRPSAIDDIDAMNSYVRIHSSFPDEALLERQNGSGRLWIFREHIVAEGSSQQASKTILSSMEIICRSRIQKRLNISRRFDQILHGDSSPSSEAAAAAEQHVVDPATAPTKASIRQLNLQHKAGRPSPPNSFTTAAATKLPDADIEFGERKIMSTQRPPIVPQFSPGVQPQTSPVGRGPPELKQSPPKDAQGPVLRADSLPFVPLKQQPPTGVQRLPTGTPPSSLNNNMLSGVKPMDVSAVTQLSGPGQHISGPGQQISGPGQQISGPGQYISGPGMDSSRPDLSGADMQLSDLSKLSRPNANLTGTGPGIKTGPGAPMNISAPGDAVNQVPLVSNNSNVSDGLLPGPTLSVAPRSVASFLNPPPPEVKLDLPAAVKVYEDIGSPPVMFESKSTGTQRLQSWLQTQLKISLQKTEEFFRYFLQGEDIKCVFVFEQRDFAAFVAGDKTKAKEGACRIALLRLIMDNRHFKSFLVKVPPDTDGNPTSTLLQFFQTYSIHKQGDELQGIYRSYMHSTTGNTMPLFECRLTFKGVELGQGRGDTKRRAREEASRRVLRKLLEAINQLDVENVWRLTIKYKGADAILDPVVAAAVGVVLNANESQQFRPDKQQQPGMATTATNYVK